jgi:hypothetical protein
MIDLALSADRGDALTFCDIFIVFFLLPSLSLLCRHHTASGGQRSSPRWAFAFLSPSSFVRLDLVSLGVVPTVHTFYLLPSCCDLDCLSTILFMLPYFWLVSPLGGSDDVVFFQLFVIFLSVFNS